MLVGLDFLLTARGLEFVELRGQFVVQEPLERIDGQGLAGERVADQHDALAHLRQVVQFAYFLLQLRVLQDADFLQLFTGSDVRLFESLGLGFFLLLAEFDWEACLHNAQVGLHVDQSDGGSDDVVHSFE